MPSNLPNPSVLDCFTSGLTHNVSEERGSCGERGHAKEGCQSAGLFSVGLVHLQKPVHVAGGGLYGNTERSQQYTRGNPEGREKGGREGGKRDGRRGSEVGNGRKGVSERVE